MQFSSLNLGAMAMKRYSTLSKAPALLEPHYQIAQSAGAVEYTDCTSAEV